MPNHVNLTRPITCTAQSLTCLSTIVARAASSSACNVAIVPLRQEAIANRLHRSATWPNLCRMAAMSVQNWRDRANATLQSLTTASAEITTKVLHAPQMYSEYVASNSRSVSQVESTLRSLTYLVPGARLHDSELASESLNSFIQLVSIYHDSVLKKKVSGKTQNIKPTHHARYTMFWTDSSSLYTKVATLLKMAQYTELLWEMLARRRGGERSRLRLVVLLESLKAICRLFLLRLTKLRPLVSPPLPERADFAPPEQIDDETEQLADDELQHIDPIPFEPKDAFDLHTGVPTPPESLSDKIPIANIPYLPPPNPANPFAMPRTGHTLPSLPSPESVSSYLLSHLIAPDDLKTAAQLMSRLSTSIGLAGEVLYILRPLIYALLMQRVARRYGYEGTKWRKQTWTPWLAGLAFDYFARQLTKQDLLSRTAGSRASGLSQLERDELTKRGWNMAWWGMRGAFYENVTKRVIHGFGEKLKGTVLLDVVGGVVEDYEYLWSEYYFSTATM